MTSMCEACKINVGERFCPRCRRVVCEGCWSDRRMLCGSCSSYKDLLEEDRHRLLNHIERNIHKVQKLIQKPSCEACPMLRELSLIYLKWVKDFGVEARRESLLEVMDRVEELRQEVTKICLWVLVKQGLKPLGEL